MEALDGKMQFNIYAMKGRTSDARDASVGDETLMAPALCHTSHGWHCTELHSTINKYDDKQEVELYLTLRLSLALWL